ncbi:pilus assembly protein CpaE [Neorhodopirellula lusitana]|uniref:Pilus assembly protein CpaE n=1 Tax=Neorhodopirellula lusitana TaxID=445327 RepID=A0ABY1Q8N6_9BACT|nr:AAA family ATPase [Neorhodopirellula lusitana]SMP60149.1 pilus assembly protein CpaE [Neorhodopirellula lusitana]
MTKFLAVVQSDSLEIELEAATSALEGDHSLDFSIDLSSAIHQMRHDAPDLLLVELSGSRESLDAWQHAIEVHQITCPIIGILDDDADPSDGLLVEAVRVGFRDFLRRPASAGELAGVIRRVARSRPESGRRGRLLAVASTKGGVGKSTIAINTAVHWAATTNQRVLLVDASLQLGVAASLLDLTPEMTIADVAAMRDRLDATMLREVTTRHESGLHVLTAPPTPADASEVDDTCMSIILGVAKSAFDLVIVDSFPLLDATTLAIFDRAEHVAVVTENVVPTLTGTAAMLKTLDQLDVRRDRRSLILNRFQSCAGSLSAAEVAEQLGEPVAAVIKYDRRVLEAANLGRPVIMSRGWWGVGGSMRKLADELLRRTGTEPVSAVVATDRPTSGSVNSDRLPDQLPEQQVSS